MPHKFMSWLAKKERGAVIVIIATTMLALMGIAALAVDIGYLRVVRNELQNVADAAALAGAGELADNYPDDYASQQSYVPDPDPIIAIAQEVAERNKAGDRRLTITIAPADVKIGWWSKDADRVIVPPPTGKRYNAVEVTARRDNVTNGPVNTFFAKVLDIDTVDVVADASAALTGQGTAEPGELELPIGISADWFNRYEGENYCGQIIKFSPSTDPLACAGWNTFEDYPANNNKVRTILEGMDGNPNAVVADDTVFNYINGNLSEGTFETLLSTYQNHGVDVDANDIPIYLANGTVNPLAGPPVPLYDDDGVTQLRYPPCSGASGCSGPLRYKHIWNTTVVVYDSSDCTPNGPILVKGFVQVEIYQVGKPSDMTVSARIKCNYVDPEPSKGGGGDFGKYGSIPGLVE